MAVIRAWPSELVTSLVIGYGLDESLETLAQKLGKSENMVRSKLVSLKLWKSNAPRPVGGSSVVRKLTIVNSVAMLLTLEKDKLLSLEKATKLDLELLQSSIVLALTNLDDAERKYKALSMEYDALAIQRGIDTSRLDNQLLLVAGERDEIEGERDSLALEIETLTDD